MWYFIEEAHERFSAEEKKRVKAEARPYGDARFVGFDRHTDILHIEVAKFLIEGLDHFSRFKGRDLDSHVLCSMRICACIKSLSPFAKLW